MTSLNGPMKLMAMDMYFMAAITNSPTAARPALLRPQPHLLLIAHPSLPPHTLRFRRLKALSHLSNTRLSEILRVDRRTPYYWEKGRPIDPVNENHLESVLQVLTSVGEVSPEQMERSILAVDEQGRSSADYLRDQNYQEARNHLAIALSNQGRSAVSTPFLGHRPFAQLQEVDDGADQGVPVLGRVRKQVKIPLKASARRA